VYCEGTVNVALLVPNPYGTPGRQLSVRYESEGANPGSCHRVSEMHLKVETCMVYKCFTLAITAKELGKVSAHDLVRVELFLSNGFLFSVDSTGDGADHSVTFLSSGHENTPASAPDPASSNGAQRSCAVHLLGRLRVAETDVPDSVAVHGGDGAGCASSRQPMRATAGSPNLDRAGCKQLRPLIPRLRMERNDPAQSICLEDYEWLKRMSRILSPFLAETHLITIPGRD
jgi:hypothetical protein